jgi:hypothetical protein
MVCTCLNHLWQLRHSCPDGPAEKATTHCVQLEELSAFLGKKTHIQNPVLTLLSQPTKQTRWPDEIHKYLCKQVSILNVCVCVCVGGGGFKGRSWEELHRQLVSHRKDIKNLNSEKNCAICADVKSDKKADYYIGNLLRNRVLVVDIFCVPSSEKVFQRYIYLLHNSMDFQQVLVQLVTPIKQSLANWTLEVVLPLTFLPVSVEGLTEGEPLATGKAGELTRPLLDKAYR